MALRPGDFVVGPGGARAGRLVGGLTSTTVHFPRALGTPAASCQPPLFAFARSFHLHLLPHYLLLIVSGERLSFCLPVCLAFFFSLSSLFLFLSAFAYLYLSPCLSSPSAVEIKESTHPWIFSRESVCRFTFIRVGVEIITAISHTYIVYPRKYQPLCSEDDRQHVAILLRISRQVR